MFYLLEDNRIIEELPLQTVIVKNQSKNVFDLIDWEEDLVMTANGQIHHCSWLANCSKKYYMNGGWITAIYKPDEEGNYIKVWEKKDE